VKRVNVQQREVLTLLSGRVVASLVQALTFILFARATPPHDYGTTMAVVGVLLALQATADLGLSPLIVRSTAKGSWEVVGRAVTLGGRVSIVLFLVGSLAIWLLTATIQGEELLYLLPLAAWSAAEKNTDLRLSVAIGEGRNQTVSRSLAIRRLSALFLFLGFSTAGMAAIPALTVGLTISSGLGLLHARRQQDLTAWGDHSALEATSLLRQARPFWINSTAVQSRNLEVQIVSAATSSADAGLYAACARLIAPVQLFAGTLAQTSLRHYSIRNEKQSFMQRNSLNLVGMSLVAVTCATLASAASPVIDLVLGAPYAGAAPVLRWMCLGTAALAASSLIASALQANHREHVVATIALFAAVVNLVAIGGAAALGGLAAAAAAGAFTSVLQTLVLVGCAIRVPESEHRGVTT
jgi:O-antigen/teichoic acid export membrane protein